MLKFSIQNTLNQLAGISIENFNQEFSVNIDGEAILCQIPD